MAFVVLVAFIFVLALRGTPPNRNTYLLVALAALVTSAWWYFSG